MGNNAPAGFTSSTRAVLLANPCLISDLAFEPALTLYLSLPRQIRPGVIDTEK
jgi:hypothetical protein